MTHGPLSSHMCRTGRRPSTGARLAWPPKHHARERGAGPGGGAHQEPWWGFGATPTLCVLLASLQLCLQFAPACRASEIRSKGKVFCKIPCHKVRGSRGLRERHTESGRWTSPRRPHIGTELPELALATSQPGCLVPRQPTPPQGQCPTWCGPVSAHRRHPLADPAASTVAGAPVGPNHPSVH